MRDLTPLLAAARLGHDNKPAQEAIGGASSTCRTTSRAVTTAAAQAWHTPFVLLCAAYRQALAAVLGPGRTTLAVAVSGRDMPESESVVGAC